MRIRRVNFSGVCFECQDRKVGCHGSCEKYLNEKKSFEDKVKVAQEAMRNENMLGAYHTAAVRRSAKKRETGR